MDTIKARNIIRKATRLIIPKLQRGFGDDKVREAHNNGALANDVRRILNAMRHKAEEHLNPNYQRFEVYMPNTIPFDELEEAMCTLKDKSLNTGIKMGIKDAIA